MGAKWCRVLGANPAMWRWIWWQTWYTEVDKNNAGKLRVHQNGAWEVYNTVSFRPDVQITHARSWTEHIRISSRITDLCELQNKTKSPLKVKKNRCGRSAPTKSEQNFSSHHDHRHQWALRQWTSGVTHHGPWTCGRNDTAYVHECAYLPALNDAQIGA